MYEDVLKKALNFLQKSQTNYGSFHPTASPFYTATILNCLKTQQATAQTQNMCIKAIAYLLTQKAGRWTFNYWDKSTTQYRQTPYPDDLDDTFCALSAIYTYKPKTFTGKTWAQVTKLLTENEVAPGGPYKTWIRKDPFWEDIDIAVNNNIAYFLSLCDIHLPNLASYIETTPIKSPYYHTQYPILYFISRWYKGNHKKLFCQTLKIALQKQINPLNRALIITALLNFGNNPKSLKKPLELLLERQNKNGSWNYYPFVVEKITNGKKHFSGSTELTTAFCIEALSKYLQAVSKKPIKKNATLEKQHQEVTSKTKGFFKNTPFKQEAAKLIDKITTGNMGNQVTSLPCFFAKALSIKSTPLWHKRIMDLGVNNLLGWLAYAIYDDILDETKDIKLLPLANMALRILTQRFSTILPQTNFQKFFEHTMNLVDNANYRETCTWLPPAQLANKSLGHVLGPVALLFYMGFNEKSIEITNTLSFFKYYLIAKQLSDDAHDWEEDLKMGKKTWVLKILRKDAQDTNDLEKLRRTFWEKTILKICRKSNFYTQRARVCLTNMPIKTENTLLENMIVEIETATKTTLRERQITLDFIKHYSKTSDLVA